MDLRKKRMIRKLSLFAFCFVLFVSVIHAQDGLNLPTELYVLGNNGQVQRYGLGAAGISTVTPESEFVVDFGVAPDGNWLAYRTEQALTILNMFTNESSVIENGAGVPSSRGRGDTLAWSPSGDALAYTTLYGGRVYFSASDTPVFVDLRDSVYVSLQWSPGGNYLVAQAEPNIWWIYQRDGTNLKLISAIPSSQGLAWATPSDIIFAPEDGGLLRMDLAHANAQSVLLDNNSIYALPFMMPDGTLGVFSRKKDDTTVPEGSGQLINIVLDKLKVTPVGQSVVDLNGLRWAPGGQLMITLRGGVMALVLPATGDGFALPASDAVAYGWGTTPPESVTTLRLPSNAYFLTADTNGVVQIWRLRKDGSPLEPVTTAEADITRYALSPNERNIAFISGGKLWLQSVTSPSGAKALVDIGQRDVRDIAFSLDGTRIAYDTVGSADSPEGGIWLVATNGGDAELVLPNGSPGSAPPVYQPPFYRQPQFAPNINALLAVKGDTESTTFTIFDLGTKASLDAGAADDAFWLPDGRVLAYGSGIGIGDPPPTQLVVAINPADLIHTQLASIPYPARVMTGRSIGNGTVRLILGNASPGPHAVNVVDLRTDNGAFSSVANGGFIAAPQLSPDGTFIAGQTHADGPLTFRDLQSGRQVVISEPATISQFEWGS
jgi:WD40 repeat protein